MRKKNRVKVFKTETLSYNKVDLYIIVYPQTIAGMDFIMDLDSNKSKETETIFFFAR
jgi:hypothetical protein